MPNYVAFLRGMNLGRRRLEMSRLKALFEELRFQRVATFIASGNVFFATTTGDATKLEQRIERHLAKALGYEVDTFVRTADEIAAVLRLNPFDDAAPTDTVHVAFLREAFSRDVSKTFIACGTPDDVFHVSGREFYWRCRTRTSDSKVWTSPEMRALKLPSMTMRNLTTMRKLAAKHGMSEV
jgi:uncharacterized protein (DUF1697 family)